MNLKSFFQCFGLLSAVVTTNLLFSPAATASNKYLAEGIFKFEGRSAIYYSNGEGEYCWYQSWNDYVRLTGNPGWRTQSGRLIDYNSAYDGACMGGPSNPSVSHPDPSFHKLTLQEGVFKFPDRSPIYYSNGEGEYCWYKSWNDYVGLTGNSGWRNQAGTLRRYVDNYDGACMGGPSDSSYSHPDPNF